MQSAASLDIADLRYFVTNVDHIVLHIGLRQATTTWAAERVRPHQSKSKLLSL